MKKEFFTIGEVAEIMDVTVKALRFYDRIGLLKPHHVDTYNHYRYYHIDQLISLDIIKMFRSLDISPNDLIPYFRNKDTEGLMNLLNHHKEIAMQKVRMLERVLSGIDQLNNTYQLATNTGKNDDIYSRHIPARHTIITPYVENKSEHDYFIDYYRLNITVSRRRLINTYESGIYLFKDENDEFYPKYLFTTISEAVDSSDYFLIPEGDYLCIQYSWDNVLQQQAKLIEYLIQHDLTPLEMVQVELLADLFPKYHSEIFELQVKV